MRVELLAPVSPGELLWEEFMAPVGLSPSALAGSTGLPEADVASLVAGSRAIDADVDRRLSELLGLSKGS